VAAVLLAVLLAACAVPAPRGTPPEKLAPPPPLITEGATHYRVDGAQSDLRFLVYRAGPLSGQGHNHVISAGTVSGDVYLNHDFGDSGMQLEIPLDSLRVDPSALRVEEGEDFAATPSAQAISGTREHMLGPDVLDAARFSKISIRSLRMQGPKWAPDITLLISLHGVTRERTVNVVLEHNDKRLVATGVFGIRQSDYGIIPYSILGGGLRVADEVRIRFRIVAVRA
jgi:polyisoprenoid-binding protein YceI